MNNCRQMRATCVMVPTQGSSGQGGVELGPVQFLPRWQPNGEALYHRRLGGQWHDMCAQSLGMPKVALCFLTRGPVHQVMMSFAWPSLSLLVACHDYHIDLLRAACMFLSCLFCLIGSAATPMAGRGQQALKAPQAFAEATAMSAHSAVTKLTCASHDRGHPSYTIHSH